MGGGLTLGWTLCSHVLPDPDGLAIKAPDPFFLDVYETILFGTWGRKPGWLISQIQIVPGPAQPLQRVSPRPLAANDLLVLLFSLN